MASNVSNTTYDSIVNGNWVLTNCEIKHIGGSASVTLKRCTVDIINGNAIVESSTDDTINAISESAMVQKAVGTTIHNIMGSAVANSFYKGVIDIINTDAYVNHIEKSSIGHITGNTVIGNIHDSTISSIDGYSRINTIDNTLVSKIDEYAAITLMHDCTVREIKGRAAIQLVDVSKIHNVADTVCIVEIKDKVDTTPTLWKRADNKKRQVTIYLRDYYSNSHRDAIKQLVSILPGITVVSNDNDGYLLHVDDNIFNILQDMTLCDYIEMLVDDTIVV